MRYAIEPNEEKSNAVEPNEEKPSVITDSLYFVDQKINILGEVIYALKERLVPVCNRDPRESVDRPETQETASGSFVAVSIKNSGLKIANFTDELEDLIKALEV